MLALHTNVLARYYVREPAWIHSRPILGNCPAFWASANGAASAPPINATNLRRFIPNFPHRAGFPGTPSGLS